MNTTLPRRTALNYAKSACRLFIVFLLTPAILKAQLPPVNPSFEGGTGSNYVAPPWNKCGDTPDTYTGGATNGSNYVGIGYTALSTPGTYEGVSQELPCELEAGKTYTFTIDIRATDTSGVAFPSTGEIEVWCGNTTCDLKELLWTSPRIVDYNWNTFTVTFTPSSNCSFLLIRTVCLSCVNNVFGEHSTYIEIDNIVAVGNYPCQLKVEADSTVNVCQGKCVTLSANVSGGELPYTYQWSGGLGTDSSANSCPSATTIYTVTVTDNKGISKTANTQVTVDTNPNCGKTGCCVNGVCEKGNGEKYPDCPDCPCYNAYGPFFNNPNPTSAISKAQAQSNGWCYSIPDSLFPGTFCFTYRHPVSTVLSLDLHITPLGCSNSFSTVTNQIHSSGGSGCSNAQNTTNNSGFMVNNWRTYDSQCSLISNTIRMGCGLKTDSLYVVCVDISAPNGSGCNGVEICPIINCYNGQCGPDHECSTSLDIDTQKKDPTCTGWSDGTVSAFPCGTLQYTYLWNDPAKQTTQTATGLVAGTYQVTLTDSFGCSAVTQIVLNDPPPVVADAGSDALVCINKEVIIGGSPTGPTGSTFTWSPTVDVSVPTASNPVVTPNVSGYYIVTVTDTAGCFDQDSVKVTVKACEILIPNIFTPVGNGVNDKFVIKGLDQYPNTHIKIFNRWGVLIYENDNYLNDWDGRHYKTLSRLNEGVYYYIVTLPADEGEYHGFVTLVRGYKF